MTDFEFLICNIREPTFFGIAEWKKLPFVFMGSSWLTRNYLLHFFSILEKYPDNFGLNLGKPRNICLSFCIRLRDMSKNDSSSTPFS